MTEKPKWTGWHTLSLFLIFAVIVLLGLLVQSRIWTWLGALILLIVFAAVAGHGITGLWRGLLIDERNKMSLSRLQMTLWAIVVLSGFSTATFSNLVTGHANPLSIAIPSELWLLMGISTTSLVGSPLILRTKMGKNPNEKEKKRTFSIKETQGTDASQLDNVGLILVNKGPEDAEVSDLFVGEETGNGAHLDLGKIQMFYFTLILVLAYAVTLGTTLASG
ncbi:MAG: hypothetical protein A2Z21_04960, partial [Candidatus Fraserbacteria bacterium RBG_16_55_9]